jgi:hypothetical protein
MAQETAALKLLENVRQNSLLKPLADSTTHVLDSYPRRHHQSLGGSSHTVQCAYTDLFSALYSDPNKQALSAKTKAAMLKTQREIRAEWQITGHKKLPT